ncbi:MAG: hypothetical protein H7A55_10400 [Verrucomicrobiaceae bacterium]|nr:hypothetical protein [Verrucomicrobiaceae bacterium]
MFKKVLQSLSKSFGSKPGAPAGASAAETIVPTAKAPAPVPSRAAAAAKAVAASPAQSPEQMCGVTPKMNKSEIHAHLKLLYRRYNRGASSLDAKTRAEADNMLDAIVQVREKHFGEL